MGIDRIAMPQPVKRYDRAGLPDWAGSARQRPQSVDNAQPTSEYAPLPELTMAVRLPSA